MQLDFLDPGKPMQNGFIESFKGKFRDEWLNQPWFTSLSQARSIIAARMKEYNTQQPHGALAERTPAKYVRATEPTTISHSLWTQTG